MLHLQVGRVVGRAHANPTPIPIPTPTPTPTHVPNQVRRKGMLPPDASKRPDSVEGANLLVIHPH